MCVDVSRGTELAEVEVTLNTPRGRRKAPDGCFLVSRALVWPALLRRCVGELGCTGGLVSTGRRIVARRG